LKKVASLRRKSTKLGPRAQDQFSFDADGLGGTPFPKENDLLGPRRRIPKGLPSATIEDFVRPSWQHRSTVSVCNRFERARSTPELSRRDG
jgi:hypothetical protein